MHGIMLFFVQSSRGTSCTSCLRDESAFSAKTESGVVTSQATDWVTRGRGPWPTPSSSTIPFTASTWKVCVPTPPQRWAWVSGGGDRVGIGSHFPAFSAWPHFPAFFPQDFRTLFPFEAKIHRNFFLPLEKYAFHISTFPPSCCIIPHDRVSHSEILKYLFLGR